MTTETPARCVAVVGPAQVGKSTLVDQLATVAAGAASVKASSDLRVASFTYLDEPWNVIDCPGSIEALQDSVDALLAADAAVICVSPDPEHAVLAAPYLRAVEAAGAPCFVFINRVDEARGRVRDIVSALQGFANHPLVLRQIPIRGQGDGETEIVGAVDLVSERAWRYRENEASALIEIPADVVEREREAREGLLDNLSEFDDWLLEEIVEDRTPADGPLYSICARVLQENRAIPVMIGSAVHGNGLNRLMKALRHEAPPPSATQARIAEDAGLEGRLVAVGFHGGHRRHVGKTVTLRVFEPGVKAGAPLGGGSVGVAADPSSEKLTPLGEAPAGAVVAALKSDHLRRGRLFTETHSADAPDWRQPLTPQIARLLSPIETRDDAKLSEALAKLAEDDPAIRLSQDPETGAHVLHAQGEMHMRSIRETLASVFGVETRDHPRAGAYRETVTRTIETHYRHKKQSGGAGQFADVKIRLAPNARGEGFTFDESVKGGAVPRNYIPAVETGAREATERGPLGFPVVDVAVTLLDGLHHAVDSSDMAFRIAARSAVREALAEATPVLLEPIYAVTFHVPADGAGALAQLVASRRGQVLGFDRHPEASGWDVFRAMAPGEALEDLIRDLRAATQGVGRFEATLDHYQEVYGKEADAAIQARAAASAK